MQVRKSLKTISKTGDSLTVAVTKEAKAIGLDKGDEATVMIGNLTPEESRNFDLALSFSNPNAYYTNTCWLTPDDHYLSGENIEDIGDTLSYDTRLAIQDRLYALKWSNDRATRFTRDKVSSVGALYSDSQRSFITKFSPVLSPNNYVYDFLKGFYQMEIIDDLLKDSYISSCPLHSVIAARKAVSRALSDLNVFSELYSSNTPYSDLQQKVDSTLNNLNSAWDDENSKMRYPDRWYFSISIHAVFGSFGEAFFTGLPSFKLYEGPHKKYVQKLVKQEDKDSEDADGFRQSIVIGPFETKEDASSIMSYLRMDSIRNKIQGSQEYLENAKKLAYELMESLAEDDVDE